MAVAVSTSRIDSPVGRHHPIGASTGYMEELRGDWNAQLAEARKVSHFAVELSALSEGELNSLHRFLEDKPALPFRYVSIHGPSKGRRLSEDALVAELREFAGLADGVVMHPDTIQEPALYRALGRKLLIENMDSRKNWGRTADELTNLYDELPEAGFCFDIAHAWSMDPEMSVASDLLDVFGDRLRHVHISSLSADLHHVPLTEDHELLFGPLLRRCLDVPWIFEAPPRSP